MTELLASFIDYAINLPWLELVAMLFALAYVLLAAIGSIWCWPAAFVSTAIYTYIFYDVLLLMDSALNIYYLVMAMYGFWVWQRDISINNEYSSSSLAIISWRLNFHVKACLILTIISLVLGYLMANYSPADFPYLDTFTTVFAIFATYLVTQKVLENWLYWLVIDAVSIYLYVSKDLMPTVVLFGIYIIIATWGYFKWRSLYTNNQIDIKQRVNG
mgnify:CR=1 FL=1